MNSNERIMRICTATPKQLARIDAILDGMDNGQSDKGNETRLITFIEAADRLGVSRSTVYGLARSGRLETRNLRGVNRITLRSVFAFANGDTHQGKYQFPAARAARAMK